jgi:chemotaxis protein MotB
MKKAILFILFVTLSATLGCVTTKEYNARLTDIDGLKKDVASLEDKLKQKETEKNAVDADLAKLRKSQDDLQKKYQVLADDHANLMKQNQSLTEDNGNLNNLLKAKKDELSKSITDLRSRIAEKENEINVKNTEIAALKKQIDGLTQEKELAIREKEKSVVEMKKTYDSLIGEMNEEIKKGEITVTQLKDKLSVNLVEKILFDSGSAEIKKNGKTVLDRVAEILQKVTDKQVRVEGHTDNVPISARLAERFPSNWELSTARATTVARYLQGKGLDPKLLSASGYSEYRPVSPNDTDEGKAKNRRIEIALIPKEL